jgi:hypothetical protein
MINEMRDEIYFPLKLKEFKNLIESFSKEVEKGSYKKVEYPTWRQLSKLCNSTDYCDVSIKVSYEIDNHNMANLDNAFILIIIHNYDTNYSQSYNFYSNDLSFGTFLIEEFSNEIYEIYEDRWSQLKYDFDTGLGTDNLGEIVKIAGSNISNLKDDYCDSTVCSDYTISDQINKLTDSFLNLKLDNEKVGESLKEISERLKETRYELHLEVEENKDMMKGFNFEFGPLNNHLAKMSIYGLAVKNKSGVYVSYDKDKAELIDVDVFQFDGSKFLYRMPVAIKDIAIGDVVIHQNIPTFVVEIPTHGKTLIVVDPCNGERKEIMLTRSPFGFNFATKIVNFLDGMMHGMAPSVDNPFGNMWMLALMDGDNKDMNKMLPFMFMNQSGMNIDPMMMMLMMGDNKDMGDMLPLMMMMNMNKPAPVEHHCNGNCHCTDGHHE